MLDLGVKLFFFASDDTVKKYIEFRHYGQQRAEGNLDPYEMLKLYGQLITEIRRDLGHDKTKCDYNDFLNIMLTDWWKISDCKIKTT